MAEIVVAMPSGMTETAAMCVGSGVVVVAAVMVVVAAENGDSFVVVGQQQ